MRRADKFHIGRTTIPFMGLSTVVLSDNWGFPLCRGWHLIKEEKLDSEAQLDRHTSGSTVSGSTESGLKPRCINASGSMALISLYAVSCLDYNASQSGPEL